MSGILAGIRVVEIGQVLAGPFAGAVFADLGADVAKIEKPAGGDDARQMGPAFRHGAALIFREFNRGKRSVTLDLTSPAGCGSSMGCSSAPTSWSTTCAPAWRRSCRSAPRRPVAGIRGSDAKDPKGGAWSSYWLLEFLPLPK
jgi:CoA-transferase family III